MTPKTSAMVHQGVLEALHDAAKRRHRRTAALDGAEPKPDYQQMRQRLNEKEFISPLDADTTKYNIGQLQAKFVRFCREARHGVWTRRIDAENCDKGLIMTFLYWICTTYTKPRLKRGFRTKQKTINQYWRDFKMLYRRHNNGKRVNVDDCAEIVKYIQGSLTSEFDLDRMSKEKPVLNVDDQLLGLTQHWSRDQSIFPTEDDRLDVAAIMLIQSCTAGRPAEFVDNTRKRRRKDIISDNVGGDVALDEENLPIADIVDDRVIDEADYAEETYSDEEQGSVFDEDDHSTDTAEVADSDPADPNYPGGFGVEETPRSRGIMEETDERGEGIRMCKALCYEDITLWVLKGQEQGKRDILALEVYLRHHKGEDRKLKPIKIPLRENRLPILCPVSHVIARAIRDDAVDLKGYTSAHPFFSTQLSKMGLRVPWKREWRKKPLFRQSIRTSSGAWVKSKTQPMQYTTYAFYINRIGRGVGSEQQWTSYCMRRGGINTLLQHAPNAVVDQVARHDPNTGCKENAYLNEMVNFDVQGAYQEDFEPSHEGLVRALTHMTLRCDPDIPRDLSQADLDKLPQGTAIEIAKREVNEERIRIRQAYGIMKRAPQEVRKNYQQLQQKLRNLKKNFRDEMTKSFQAEFREQLHKAELERQLNKAADEESEQPVPVTRHQLEERNQLQLILCDFNKYLDAHEITRRKIQAIDLMVALASRREVRPFVSSKASLLEPIPTETEIRSSDEIPRRLDKTQCIFCVGDETLPLKARMRKFNKVANMNHHVKNVHFRHLPSERRYICHHPDCKPLGDFLIDLDHFKAHVYTVHGQALPID